MGISFLNRGMSEVNSLCCDLVDGRKKHKKIIIDDLVVH